MFIYAANNPINNSDPSGQWIIKNAIKWVAKKVVKPAVNLIKKTKASARGTETKGLNLSGAFGVDGSVSAGITTDKKGNIGIILTSNAGVGTPSGSLCAFETNTNAPDIYTQRGASTQIGGSLDAYGVNVGAEYSFFQDSKTNEIYHGVTFWAGMSFEPTPAELHGEKGKSVVYGFNVYEAIDYLYVKIMEW